MHTRSKNLPLLPLLLILFVAAGCLFSPPEKDPIINPLPPYEPYYDADPTTAMNNLVANFVNAWERRDLAQYRDSILFNGNEVATDGGEDYQAFTFYYDRSIDPNLPEPELYDRELQRATNMFGGLPGDGVPGIKSISLNLSANQQWANPTDITVDGDSYPPGTKWRSYNTDMVITLKSNIGGTDINVWTVRDRLIFHLIPTRVENTDSPGTYHTRYKLWKWRDVIDSE